MTWRWRVLVARARIAGQAVHGAVADARFYPIAGDVFAGDQPAGASHPLADLELLSPVEPTKILVVMGGFRPEDGAEVQPDEAPVLLPKVQGWLQGDGARIEVPPSVGRVWAEVELAVIVGRRIRSVSLAEAAAAIFGYACFNDASAPEFLAIQDYWRLKSIDTFGALGPWVRTDLTEEQIRSGLGMTTRVNGVLRAEGNTRMLKFAPSAVVQFAAGYSTLYPGDVISLGTPRPARVGPGDQVELAIEGIGVLRNQIVAASSAAR